MKRHQVVLSEEAESDLVRIYGYIYADLVNPFGAKRTIDGILERCNNLTVFPAGGTVKVSRQGLDFRFAHFGNYTIIYYIDGDSVTIHRIFYSFRNIPELF